MPRKRIAPAAQSSCYEETDEGLDPVFQEGEDVKRAKLATLSDKTLQDLPIEMLERILVRAVVMEVKDMKLAKCAWKEKADLVMNRLQTVCTQWKNILTSNDFRNVLHKTLDGIDQKTIRLEVLHQFPIRFSVFYVTTLKDEMFIVSRSDDLEYVINVCELGNKALELKDVIPLSGFLLPLAIAGCSVSNCVYVLKDSWAEMQCSVLRITKDGDHSFHVSTLIDHLDLGLPIFSVSAKGSLIILSKPVDKRKMPVVFVYKADGSLQHRIRLSRDISGYGWFSDVMQRPNGNFVLFASSERRGAHLTEINSRGRLVHHHKSRLSPSFGIHTGFADVYGRIFMTDWCCALEILDKELNQLDVEGSHLHLTKPQFFPAAHFNREKNEIAVVSNVRIGLSAWFTIFRFTEE